MKKIKLLVLSSVIILCAILFFKLSANSECRPGAGPGVCIGTCEFDKDGNRHPPGTKCNPTSCKCVPPPATPTPIPTPQCGDLPKTACTGGACSDPSQACITVYYSNGTPMQCSCCPGGSAYCPTPTPVPTATPTPTPATPTPTATPWCGFSHAFPGCTGGPCPPGLTCQEDFSQNGMNGCGCLPPDTSDMPGDGTTGGPMGPTGEAKPPTFLQRLDSGFKFNDLT